MRLLLVLALLALAACSSSYSDGPDAAPGTPDAAGTGVDAFVPDQSLVYAHSGGHLYRIDTRTLAPVDIGPFGLSTQSITDIAVDKDGAMVGITLDKLYSIDVTTGAATLIKDLSTDAQSQNFTSLSYVPLDFNDPKSAEILVAASTQGQVYEIDPTDGSATLLGSYGTTPGGAAIGSSGDIVAVRGLGILATVNLGSTLTDPDYLATIDPTTWAATPLAQSTGFDRIFGLAFWKDTVYGFVDDAGDPSGAGSFITIDINTGAGSLVQDLPIGWYGAGVTTNAPVIVN
jgi:hypothetical protein